MAINVPTAMVATANQEAVSVRPRRAAGTAVADSEAMVAMMAVVIVENG